MYMYDRPSWTGHVYETEAFFPTWINKETAPHVQALVTRTTLSGAPSASARTKKPCPRALAVP